MNYQKITKFDTANGPGIRTTLWVSGCSHYCKGCHNPQTWDPDSGNLFTIDTLAEIRNSLEPDYIAGLTLSGGDPLYPDNIAMILFLVKYIKQFYPNKSIWMWTGYLYEDIRSYSILDYVDVLVDGPFILEQRDITLAYRGSPNQRVIDVKKSRLANQVILWNKS